MNQIALLYGKKIVANVFSELWYHYYKKDNRIQITSDGQNSLYIIADKLEYLIKRDWIT